MILFSTLTQGIEFLLFTYLGLISGLIYEVINIFCLKVLTKTQKAEKSPLKQKKMKNKANTQKILLKANDGENKPKKTHKKINIKSVFIKSLKIFCYLFAKILPLICFTLVSVLSYLINLKLNFGFVKVIYVLFWIGFFFVGKRLCNLLANYFLAFYNWTIKKVKKCQKNNQKIKENQNCF